MARYGLDNPKKALFLDWLLDPVQGEVDSIPKLAPTIGVSVQTLRNWQKLPAFRKAWETELAKRNVDPGKVQKVIDAMFLKAEMGDTVAAKLVLEYVSRFAPPPELDAADDVSELSDEELEAAYRDALGAEVQRRSVGDDADTEGDDEDFAE